MLEIAKVIGRYQQPMKKFVEDLARFRSKSDKYKLITLSHQSMYSSNNSFSWSFFLSFFCSSEELSESRCSFLNEIDKMRNQQCKIIFKRKIERYEYWYFLNRFFQRRKPYYPRSGVSICVSQTAQTLF